METKNITFGSDARARLTAGVNKIAKAVSSSLGPRGRTTIIASKHGGQPICTKDGVSIAKACLPLKDVEENLGAQVIKDASDTTCNMAGDGTTSCVVIAQELVNSGMKLLAAGADPASLKRGMEKATEAVVEELKKIARPVESNKDIKDIATISANSDTQIGELIAAAMDVVGNSGIITVEESKGTETKLRTSTGYELSDRGFIHPGFVNEPERQRVVYENALVWLVNAQLNNTNHMNDMLPVLEFCSKNGNPLVLIAENVEAEPLGTMVLNAMRRSLKCVAIKCPGYGDRRKQFFEDLAVITGAHLRDASAGEDALRDTQFDELGSIKRIEVYKEKTIIVGPDGREAEIEAHANAIRATINQETSTWDRERTEQRLAKLLGGVAVIEIAGQTEIEMKERKDRLEDSLQAVRAAVAEGYCVGGGAALLKAREALKGFTTGNHEMDMGVGLVMKACAAPFKKICENSGELTMERVGVIMAEISNVAEPQTGYDAQKHTVCDLLSAGVIDPVKVVRVSLQNAVSASSMLLLTETMITTNEDPPPPGNPMMGMG